MRHADPFQELYSRMRDGNEQAAEELFDQALPRVRRVVRHMLRAVHIELTEDDIMQTVVRRFWASTRRLVERDCTGSGVLG